MNDLFEIPESKSIARSRYRIKGESRRFYSDPDTLDLDGREVTSTHPDAIRGHWTSRVAPPVPCLLEDGTPCYVKPFNLEKL